MNSKKMIEFIEKSPSVFHAVKNVCINLKENGFDALTEDCILRNIGSHNSHTGII